MWRIDILVRLLCRSPPLVHIFPIPLRLLPLVILVFPLVILLILPLVILLILSLVIMLIRPGWFGILRPLGLLWISFTSIIPIRLILWRTLGITIFPLITILNFAKDLKAYLDIEPMVGVEQQKILSHHLHLS